MMLPYSLDKPVFILKCLQKKSNDNASDDCLAYFHIHSCSSCVRGESGPTAYIIEKVDETASRFTWLLNVDLKVNSWHLELSIDWIDKFSSGLAATIFNQQFTS
jgi:hypothetical protein